MTGRDQELQRLIKQQGRDDETNGVGRGWGKKKTYPVDFQHIENTPLSNLSRFQKEVKKKIAGRQHEDTRCKVDLELVLKELPKRDRLIVKRKLWGYSGQEIAEELNTYRMDIWRTMNRLRPRFGLEKR